MEKTIILTHSEIEKKLDRIAWQIFENNLKEKEVFIIGIANSGYKVAKIIANILKKITKSKVVLCKIELNKKAPLINKIIFSGDKNDCIDKSIVIIDDVLNSGKTMMYAINYFLDVNIKKITSAVLVDRSHQSFPVKSNYVGLKLSTSLQEHVKVNFGKKNIAYLE